MYTYVIPCLLGLEKLVSDECKRLGLQDVKAENGRVLCRGTLAACARLNINLRCGARVMLVLADFPARSFEELFQGTRAVAWEDYLPRDAAFPVKGYSISSQLHAVPACQSIIKKAMVERMKSAYHLEQFPETGAKYQGRFAIFKDQVLLTIRSRDFSFVLEEKFATIFSLLERFRIKTNLIHNSAVNLSLCVDNSWHIDEAIEALREAGFDVMKAENMELLTVRGYTDELWRKYARGPQVFVRQATQSTVRVVRKK